MAKRPLSSRILDTSEETDKKGKKIISEQSVDLIDLERITLRSFELSDIKDFMSWASDPEIYRFVNDEPPASKEDGVVSLKARMVHPWYLSICLDNKSIGEISVTWILTGSESSSCRAEICYAVGSAYWQRGIATRAVKLVLRHVFWNWRLLKRLQAIVVVENVASQRVLEKAGFVREGVLRKYYMLKTKPSDVVVYSLLSTEFLASEIKPCVDWMLRSS